jgi:short-subunit dehydrogenase
MSTALRQEAAPFGVQVVLIEPGPIATEFRSTASTILETEGVPDSSVYEGAYRQLEAYWAVQYKRGITGPAAVGCCIQHAVESRKPRARYRVRAVAKWAPLVASLVPDRLYDAIVRWQMRAHKPTR